MDRGGGGNLIVGLGFAFLTGNSLLAIYRSNGDLWSVTFVVSAYLALLLLFWCLRLYEQAAPNPAQRGRLKAAVWSLSTFISVMFAYKVAALIPWPVVLLVWGMTAAVAFAGFYAFFIHRAL